MSSLRLSSEKMFSNSSLGRSKSEDGIVLLAAGESPKSSLNARLLRMVSKRDKQQNTRTNDAYGHVTDSNLASNSFKYT
jgi:hypothetical protein